MDTPIKLIKHYFKIDKNGNRIDHYYDQLYLDIDQTTTLFNIEETDNISLVFDFLPNEYEIEIENANTGEMTRIKPGVEFDLSVHDTENAFFPGYFDILIKKQDLKTRCCFCVHPKQLELNDVFHLREYVNSYYEGVSLDLEKSRKMNVAYDSKAYSIGDFSSYNFIIQNYSTIINYINRYTKSRHDQLIKKEVVSPKITKLTNKSLKWLVQNAAKNKDVNYPEVILTEKTVFTLNNEQNRIFKSYVIFWNEELAYINNRLSDFILKIDTNIEKINQDLKVTEEDYSLIKEAKTVSPFVKKQLIGKITDLSNNIKSLKSIKIDYQKRQEMIKHYKNFTESIIYNSWIYNISEEVNYSHKNVQSKELILLKEMREKYIGVRRKANFNSKQKIDYFAEKSTPKLFETYIYVLLINILKSKGFVIDESIYPVDDVMMTLSRQSIIILKNISGAIVEIIYDNQLIDAQKSFIESCFCTINSTHNKPDFILAFKNSDGLLIDSIIIEAKWRRLNNIYNEYGDTEVMTNLRDYSNLCYYDANDGVLKRGVISKVIVVYPDVNEKYISVLGGLIIYLGINISKDLEASQNFAMISAIIDSSIAKLF